MREDLIIKVNEEIAKCVSWINENEEMFNYMNLKLYDISHYCFKDMENDFPLCVKNDSNDEYSYFSTFCDDSYYFFKENLQESYGIDFEEMYNQLGRTSSFYLHDCNIIDIDRRGNLNINFDYFLEYYFNYFEDLNIDTNYNLTCDEYYYTKEENNDILRELIDNLYDNFIKHFKDIIIVYNEIKSFKEKQVEYFKDFLQSEEEKLQEEIDAEEKKTKIFEAERNAILKNFASVKKEILFNSNISNKNLKLL